jgi:alpha-ketoglutarate-dependent taurine dioxygenase
MTTPQPPHPLGALTTFELSRYRRELEHSLRSLPGQAPARAQLQQQLAQVMAEQDSRTQICQANGYGPGSQ